MFPWTRDAVCPVSQPLGTVRTSWFLLTPNEFHQVVPDHQMFFIFHRLVLYSLSYNSLLFLQLYFAVF